VEERAVEGCALCGWATGGSDAQPSLVFARHDWELTVFPGFDVPGWYFLQCRSHVGSLADLPFGVLQAFGPMLSASVEAIRRATRCEKVYICRFGETFEHWHMLLAARARGIPEELRGPRLFTEKDRFRDSSLAHEVAGRVADELERIVELEPQGRS
jgi:diadenosine tetraphosphate (Ap4A) HIT family hydrolase